MRLRAAKSHEWWTSVPCLWKYLLLFCCSTPDSQKNTKAWHFCFVYDIYKGTDKHRGCVTHQSLVPKTLSDWTVTAGHGATLNPILFFLFNFSRLALLLCFLAAGSWTGTEMQSQWMRRIGGWRDYSSHDAPVSLITGWISGWRPRGVISFIHCKWEKNVPFIKWLLAWN